MLYSCQTAAGEAGAELIERLYHLTGTNIAASRLQIGNDDSVGQCYLEVTTSPVAPIDSRPKALAQYAGVLESVDLGQIELVGGAINGGSGPDARLSTWFLENGLGSSGGASGVADGSAGCGLKFCGGRGFTSPIDNGLVLFVNDTAFATSNNQVE